MTFADFIQLVSLKLGEQTAFYAPDEIVHAGLNPAYRLLCLVYPGLLHHRTIVTVGAEQPFIDLRGLTDAAGLVVGNRIRRVNRVILGDVSGDTPIRNAATGEFTELTMTSVGRLASVRNWLEQRGEVQKYWLWGKVWLGLYKRPIDTVTITIMFTAAPLSFDMNTPGQVPSVLISYHPVIAEIAAGLLLIKEGQVEGQRGLSKIINALGIQSKEQAS